MAGARRPEPGVVAIQRAEALAAVHGAVRRVRGFGRIDAPTRARRQRRVLVRQQPQRRRARVHGRPAHVVRLGRRPTPCHGVRLGPPQMPPVPQVLALQAKKGRLVVRRPHGPGVPRAVLHAVHVLGNVAVVPRRVAIVGHHARRPVRRHQHRRQLGRHAPAVRPPQHAPGELGAHVIQVGLARHADDAHQHDRQHLDARVGLLQLQQPRVLQPPRQRRAGRHLGRWLQQGSGPVQQAQQLGGGGHDGGPGGDVRVAQLKRVVHDVPQPHAFGAPRIQPHGGREPATQRVHGMVPDRNSDPGGI